MEKVVVILVDYNTSELIPEVLDAIKEDKVDVSVLIVDNGSSKESYENLKKIKDNRVHIVRLEENVGIGGGNNYGIRYAAEHYKDAKYVFLLNTDAFITKDLIFNLVSIMEGKDDVACISPNIVTRDGDSWYNALFINYKRGSVSPTKNIHQDEARLYYEVDVFNGCAVLFDLKKLLQVGMLNDKLFMYYEEADCSLKLHKLGYKILYTPHYEVVHWVSFTTRNTSYLKTYYMTRNKFFMFNKTMPFRSKVYYLGFEFINHLKYKRFRNAYYLFRGYLDYKRGRTGKLQQARN